MATFLDKFKIKTAIEKNTTLDLSCQHLTTANFMELQPVYVKEMVPGESIEVTQQTFTRLAPLAVPTLGRALIHNRAFFVPMRTIMTNWDEFITEASVNRADTSMGNESTININSVPEITNDRLVRMFLCENATSSTESTGCTIDLTKFDACTISNAFVRQLDESEGDDYDSADISATVYKKVTATTDTAYGVAHVGYFNLTNYGRQVLKVLQSLGYAPIWTCQATNDSDNSVNKNYADFCPQTSFSLLPIFAYFKLVIDWYWPSQYVGDADYNYIKSVMDYHVQSTGIRKWQPSHLARLFARLGVRSSRLFGVNYDSSYITSAFETPDGDSASVPNTTNIIKDITRETLATDITITNDSQDAMQGTPVIEGLSSQGSTLSQYALTALKAMTDYMKRHQLVGARALDRFYARFGISLASEKLDRSNYIGAQNIPIEFGDVMSHADTNGAALGDYAGRGLGYGEDKFSFKSDDYGYFVICSSIVPQVGYYEGVDRMVKHLSPLDFWTPEFDQLGNQAIGKDEVYVPMNDTYISQVPYDIANKDLSVGIFGYAPRYAEYKVGKDRMTGDFRLRSKSGVGPTSNAWSLMRTFEGSFQGSADIVMSKYVVRDFDARQYNRIFNITSEDVDHFYIIHNFNVVSNSPMHSLFDSYQFDSNGKTVVADVNGVKVN